MSTEAIALFTPGNSFFHKVSPFTKLILALSLIFAAFMGKSILIPLSIFGISITFLLLAGVFKQAVKSVFQYAFMMILILFVVQSFWYSGGESPIWELGPLNIKVLGFQFASFIALRLLIVITCFYVMLFTTHPGDLVVSLEQHNFSPKLSYIFLATLQSIGELQSRLKLIMEVQQCRGVEVAGNVFQRAKAYLPLMGPLVIGSLLSIESRALALEVRGFSSKKRTHLRKVVEQPWERGARIFLVVLPLISLATRWL
jgi:energy-coupling factor transport system permease protein